MCSWYKKLIGISPSENCKKALRAVDAWWDSFFKPNDLFLEKEIKIKFCLYGSPEVGRKIYKQKHNAEIPSTLGSCWIGCGADPKKAEFEIWVLMSEVGDGAFCNEWTLGHEFCHLLEWISKAQQIDIKFLNPDDAVKEEFYE